MHEYFRLFGTDNQQKIDRFLIYERDLIKFLLITIILLLDLILKLNDIRKKIINELEIKLTLIQRFNVI